MYVTNGLMAGTGKPLNVCEQFLGFIHLRVQQQNSTQTPVFKDSCSVVLERLLHSELDIRNIK